MLNGCGVDVRTWKALATAQPEWGTILTLEIRGNLDGFEEFPRSS